MSQYDVAGLFDFLAHTPEQGLRKMLVDQKTFTEAHFNMMLKIVRAGDLNAFTEHFEKKDFPKVKFGPAEMKLKDKFWDDCITVMSSKGILQPAVAAKAA